MPKLKGNLYSSKEAWVEVYFVGFKNPLDFLIDTGFNGSLCLPDYIAKELELEIEQAIPFTGIGNHKGSLKLSTSKIKWFGEDVETSVIINDGNDFLIGTGLLENKELCINYKTGQVVITQM